MDHVREVSNLGWGEGGGSTANGELAEIEIFIDKWPLAFIFVVAHRSKLRTGV